MDKRQLLFGSAQLRRDTAANWALNNPVLRDGEPGVVTDTSPRLMKMGDGVTRWNDLQLVVGGLGPAGPVGPIGPQGIAGPPGDAAINYTPPATTPAAPKFTTSFQNLATPNGPPGEPNYYNHIGHIGWNFVGADRVDLTQAGYGLSFESRYYQSGVFAHEFHLQGVDIAGGQHRWLSFFLPTQAGGAGSGATFKVDNFDIAENGDSPRVQMRLAGSAPSIALLNSTKITYDTNNIAPAQRNAAGTSFLTLPFIDSFDRTSVTGPLFISAPKADAEYNAVVPINAAGITTGKSILYAQSNVVTGTVYAMNFANLAATTGVYATIGNNSVNGHTVLELANRAGTGDTFVALSAADDSMGWSLGVDQSATAFKICAGLRRLGGSGGTEDRVVIDDSRAAFARPVKVPSYTVAGLPSASSAGAGALVYVSNASGGATLASSDGTNWRVIAALGAVVS